MAGEGVQLSAGKARRKINAGRGKTLHSELVGSQLTEHDSGELVFELAYSHAGIDSVICGHQTGRKKEHTSFTLPLPPGWSAGQLLAGLSSAQPAMAYFSAEQVDDNARFQCEGIGMPGSFFDEMMSLTAAIIASEVS